MRRKSRVGTMEIRSDRAARLNARHCCVLLLTIVLRYCAALESALGKSKIRVLHFIAAAPRRLFIIFNNVLLVHRLLLRGR